MGSVAATSSLVLILSLSLFLPLAVTRALSVDLYGAFLALGT
jgi:hypothetical protein